MENKDLQTKYEILKQVFEDILAQHIVLNELRDFYRHKAGIK